MKDASLVRCFQDHLCFQRLGIPDVNSWTHIDLARSNQALERMSCNATYFHLMALVESLVILCRVVDDGEARCEVDNLLLAKLVNWIVLGL